MTIYHGDSLLSASVIETASSAKGALHSGSTATAALPCSDNG